MADIVQRIITEVINLDQIEQNDALIKKLTDDIVALDLAMKQSNGGTAGQAAMLKRMAEAMADAAAKNKQLMASLDDVGGATNRAGRSMMELGRIAQDTYQGGIAGALNNIEGMVRALGGGAGLAGALTVAGVAFHAFGPGLKAFAQSFVEANPKIKEFIESIMGPEDSLVVAVDEAKRRLKDLSDKPVKIAVDYREIETLEKRIESLTKAKRFLEGFKNPPTEVEQESSRRVNEAFDASPNGRVGIAKELEDHFQRELKQSRKSLLDVLKNDVSDWTDRASAAQTASVISGKPEIAMIANKFLYDARAKLDKEMESIRDEAKNRAGELLMKAGGGHDPSIGRLIEIGRADKNPLIDRMRPELAKSRAPVVEGDAADEVIAEQTEATVQKQIEGYRDARKRRSEQASKDQKAAQEQAASMQAEMLARMAGLDRAGKGFDDIRPAIRDTLSKRGFAGQELDRLAGNVFAALSDAYTKELNARIRPGVSPTSARNRLAEDMQAAVDRQAMGPSEKAGAKGAKKSLADRKREEDAYTKDVESYAKRFGQGFARTGVAPAFEADARQGRDLNSLDRFYGHAMFNALRPGLDRAEVDDAMLSDVVHKIVQDFYDRIGAAMQQETMQRQFGPGFAAPGQQGRARGPAGGFRSVGIGDLGMGGPAVPDNADQAAAMMLIGRNQLMTAQAQAQNDARMRQVMVFLETVGRTFGNNNSRRTV